MTKEASTKTKRKKIKTVPFDAAEALDTPEAVAEYINAAFETKDPSFIAKAIKTTVRARGPGTGRGTAE